MLTIKFSDRQTKSVVLTANLLAWQDIRARYRRSAIGPFWLTISMGVLIASIGLVFGQLFNTPMDEYLPFLAAGIILWTFITSVINEGCSGFIDAESIIKQLPIPFLVHILRIVWRNLLILVHNIIILPLVFLVMGKDVGLVALLAIPGLIFVVLCLGWIAFLCAIVCTRYRDLSQIITNVLQVAFYLTPIIWMPSLIPDRVGANLLDLNPFFHLLELIRGPLLGNVTSLLSWGIVGGATLIGWGFTLLVFRRLCRRKDYWL